MCTQWQPAVSIWPCCCSTSLPLPEVLGSWLLLQHQLQARAVAEWLDNLKICQQLGGAKELLKGAKQLRILTRIHTCKAALKDSRVLNTLDAVTAPQGGITKAIKALPLVAMIAITTELFAETLKLVNLDRRLSDLISA